MLEKIFKLMHRSYYKILDLRAWYISIILKECGNNFKLWGNCHIKNPNNIIVGNNVSLNDGCYLNGKGSIEIGNNVSISALAIIVSTGLDVENFKKEKKHVDKQIIIGNNVQIGAAAIILSGVKIGNNVIIGAGSVVTKSIEDNVIVVGNPARIIKRI